MSVRDTCVCGCARRNHDVAERCPNPAYYFQDTKLKGECWLHPECKKFIKRPERLNCVNNTKGENDG